MENIYDSHPLTVGAEPPTKQWFFYGHRQLLLISKSLGISLPMLLACNAAYLMITETDGLALFRETVKVQSSSGSVWLNPSFGPMLSPFARGTGFMRILVTIGVVISWRISIGRPLRVGLYRLKEANTFLNTMILPTWVAKCHPIQLTLEKSICHLSWLGEFLRLFTSWRTRPSVEVTKGNRMTE